MKIAVPFTRPNVHWMYRIAQKKEICIVFCWVDSGHYFVVGLRSCRLFLWEKQKLKPETVNDAEETERMKL